MCGALGGLGEGESIFLVRLAWRNEMEWLLLRFFLHIYIEIYLHVCVTVCTCTFTTIQVDACPTENASMLSRPSYEQIPAESLERKNH